VREFSFQDWETVIWHARTTRLSGRIWHHLNKHGTIASVPGPALRRLKAAYIEADYDRRTLLWEVDRLHRAFQGTDISFILLKGAAYAAAGLDVALGRLAGDIDIMVSEETILHAEQILLRAGWEHLIENEYDQKYYRRWMHELPPLRHSIRETELDLHHAIVPRTSRLKPNMPLMYSAAIVIDERGTKILAPVDMFLHCAVHLFHDGEIRGALRDLVDIDELARGFGATLWPNLVPRAKELGLLRPLFYALHYANRILDTPIPTEVMLDALQGRPSSLVLQMMDLVVPTALAPALSAADRWSTRLSTLAVQSRAHWLRMAPGRLAVHLARKSARRLTEA
jgi:hypothetical protein